jgi:hypothetical protein
MADPILDEIRRVREELVKKHGGLEGYFAYVQKLDRARRARGKRPSAKTSRRRAAKSR